jgi:hypothetical protein
MASWEEDSNVVPEADDARRYGGPQAEGDGETAVADSGDSEVKRKAAEREQKKAEVRKRLEEAGKAGKKAKKGFLTPERKKKLRKLLMMKAAEDLKHQSTKRQQERQNVLSSRIPPLPNIDTIEDKGQLEKIYNDLFQRMVKLEEEKFDINYVVSTKDADINEMSIAVNDLRGKFVKPSLKKVSKYDNKFKKFNKNAEGAEGGGAADGPKKDFRAQLKVVKKENVVDEIVAKKKSEKPEWSKKGGAAGDAVAAPKRGSVASSQGGGSGKPAKEEQSVAEEEPVAEEPEEEEGEEEEEEGEEEEE